MWEISGKAVSIERFRPFEPLDVLYDFDGPRIFTLIDPEGELNLVYWSDEDQHVCRYVIVPTTSAILRSLRNGNVSVFDALDQPRCWVCDVTHQGDVSKCMRVEFENVPRDALPAVRTLLMPTLGSDHVDLQGRIRELDKDRLSFELREIHGTTNAQRFFFSENLFEAVWQAFQENARVQVAGRTFPEKDLAYAEALSQVKTSDA